VSLEARLSGLPAGFEVLRGVRGVLAVRCECRAEIARAGFGPDEDGALARSALAGRAALRELALASGTLLVRRFRHGGLLRAVRGNRFGDPERVFRELELSEALRAAGIETPPVVAARARRATGGGFELDLLTRRVEGALDGLRALQRTAQLTGGAALRARLFAESGRFVARLHLAGLFHADLTPRNLLVDEAVFSGAPARFHVLDLDRSRLAPALSERERVANLARLARFLLRRRGRGECSFGSADLVRFLRGYADGSGGAYELERTGRGVARRLRRSAWIHRLGWRLEERAGAGPEARDGRPPAREVGHKGLDK
jgi:hypothetical protein